MEKETINNILSFLEKVDGAKMPFIWKITNGLPLTEDELKKMVEPGYIKGDILNEDPDWDETEFAF